MVKATREHSLNLTERERDLGLYILVRLVIGLSLLCWAIWTLHEHPAVMAAVRPQFYIAASAFFFMGLSAALAPRLAQWDWFLWTQMIVDAVFVSALVATSEGFQSPFFVLYCVNIIGAVRLLSTKGVMSVAVLDSAAYLAVGVISILSDNNLNWNDDQTSLLVYTQLLFRIFGLLLIGVLSVSLAVRQAATQKALVEQVQMTRLITEQHETLLDKVPLAVLTVGKGLITSQNLVAESIFGNITGQSVDSFFPMNLQRWEIEWKVHDKLSLLEGRLASISDELQVVIIEDVTRIREIEAIAVREDRLAAVGRLAASLAHEIRNPLASLSGSVQLLSESGKGRLHDIILREVKRLNELVEEFLRTSKPPELQRAYLRPLELIDEVFDTFRNDPRCLERDLQQKIIAPTPVLYLDPKLFRQILWNLLLNAAQATVSGDTISIAARVEAASWILLMEDTGSGIPKSQLERIFDPFYTTRAGGTGLGLANVQRIVHAHGGQITVESTEGEGTSFLLSFPIPRR